MIPASIVTDASDRPIALRIDVANGTLEAKRERKEEGLFIVASLGLVTFQQQANDDMQALAMAVRAVSEQHAPIEAKRYTEWDYEQTLKILCW